VFAFGRECDVRDPAALTRMISTVKPDNVVYLAAITTLRESVANPRDTYDINFGGVLNVLMTLRQCRFSGRMLFISSSEVYGLLSEGDLPVSEMRLPQPRSPYAVSKVAAEALCYQWSQTEEFEVISARPFNHIGPGQSKRFAIAEFARQIAAIKLGLAEATLLVGDIDTTRDFTDVRDVAHAYAGLLDRGRNGEVYNVCSGSERSVRSLIMRMCELAEVRVELREDPGRLRASDQRRVCGSNAKLTSDVGWQPRYTTDQTLTDILSFSLATLTK
jgi:GDP-4-dehydro-6-deoxy-D-mannose reductase